MAKDQSEPQGEMILRTLAMPADTKSRKGGLSMWPSMMSIKSEAYPGPENHFCAPP
jgi:hypothetical protein